MAQVVAVGPVCVTGRARVPQASLVRAGPCWKQCSNVGPTLELDYSRCPDCGLRTQRDGLRPAVLRGPCRVHRVPGRRWSRRSAGSTSHWV